MTLEVQITFDCADPAAMCEFWSAVLGYELQAPPPGFDSWDDALDSWGVPADQRNAYSAAIDPDGKGPRLFFQQVPEPKTVKNRVHLDVRSAPGLEGAQRMAALEKRQRELEGRGATLVERVEPDPSKQINGFIVMQDPEGNEFCLD